MSKNDDNIEYWFSTDSGAHIPVRKGQTKEQALAEFLKSKGDPLGLSAEELKRQQSKRIYNTDEYSSLPSAKRIADRIPENVNASHGYAEDGSKLKITDAQVPGAKKLYDEISSGKYYSAEELLAHPTVKKLDEIATAYKKQYGNTADIDTPERRKMRQEWERDFLSQGSMVEVGRDSKGNPIYEPKGKVRREHKAVIVIGLPAAGKSTVIANPESARLGAFVFDSDDIKTRIPEFKATNGGAAGAVHDESKLIQEKALSHFLQGGDRNGDNLVIPLIGSNYSKLQRDWISRLEAAGYDVEIQFKDADPKASMNRVISRAIKTGRIIPSDVVTGYGDKPRGVYKKFKGMKNKHGKPYVRTTPKK